jgi:hypothetical protein
MTEELNKDLKELKNKFPNIVELKSLSVFQVIKRYPSIKALINLLEECKRMLETFESILNKHLVNLSPEMRKEFKNRLISETREKDGDKAASDIEKFISTLNISV